MMQLPKMTKAHRMYLYGVLTTGVVALLIAVVTISVYLLTSGARGGNDAMAVVINSRSLNTGDMLPPQPGDLPRNTLPPPANMVRGWVKSSTDSSLVVETTEGDRTIRISDETTIKLLDAAALNPIESTTIAGAAIPKAMLAHITLRTGTTDTASEIVVVKNHD